MIQMSRKRISIMKTMDAFRNGTGDVCGEMIETKDRDLR